MNLACVYVDQIQLFVIVINPSNCECECDKSCGISECLDYKNCRCKKRVFDKLIEKCTKNIDET